MILKKYTAASQFNFLLFACIGFVLSACSDGTASTSGDQSASDREHSGSSSSNFSIQEAVWSSQRSRLTVSGTGDRRKTVTVINSATSESIGSVDVRRSTWSLTSRNLDNVPCRVKATQSNGKVAEMPVSNAPSNCDDGNTGGGGNGGGGNGGGGSGGGNNGSVSINSTSQNGMPGTPVTEQLFTTNTGYNIFASNDLGMHCGDLDTRISSILPPFNNVHAQVVLRGSKPSILDNTDIEVVYSAASNPNDPILTGTNSAGSGPVASSMLADGSVYKTNFWDVATVAYDAFYPPGVLTVAFPTAPDLGLPMPDVERLYLGDHALNAKQQEMPGRSALYLNNDPLAYKFYVLDQPFFFNFPFGYTVSNVDWFEAAGIPLTAFDDFGRENPWPLMRVQAKSKTTTEILASIDTVLPISGEANCGECHNAPNENNGNSGIATRKLDGATSFMDDPASNVPEAVSLEWAADVNILRLHDLKHGTQLITGTTVLGGTDTFKPVVCQSCHYTPALDLAQLGPLGPEYDPNGFGNGRDQWKHRSMSNVMHKHHGQVDSNGRSPGDQGYDAANLMFPAMPASVNPDGSFRDFVAAKGILDETCYQCHPGRRTDCLRGAMANGGMVCQDCHGNMNQVGNDFTDGQSPATPGPGPVLAALGSDFYDHQSPTVRVPWANEPGCGSCHTGDALDNKHAEANTLGDPEDGIRLMQAYRIGDTKATPIVPSNKRFAENTITAADVANNADQQNLPIGNPMLYRVSKGHGGVFCEGCHGATHGIWPNKNPEANDNVAATQLQGHSGTITECSTCHEGDLGNTLNGPHGMHPVGDTRFSNGGHEDMVEHNSAMKDVCRACHGKNGEGTVLARVATDRVLSSEHGTVTLNKGDQVTCDLCHSNKL